VNRSKEQSKKNPSEAIRQQLKNLSAKRNRPFDEILRYYAMERFLYRLSISPYSKGFFLKGGLMLKVWNPQDHRATTDIDLLAKISNKIENLKQIIHEVSQIQATEDAIMFNTQKLILRTAQVGGEYEGISASFSAQLDKTQIPILTDIGFNDFIIPEPHPIDYPTLLNLPSPKLMGYTPETVIAEKLESIVKLGLVNTRMKDFYDIWNIFQNQRLNPDILKQAINDVFSHRNTKLEYPIAFSQAFYNTPAKMRRWEKFLSLLGKEHIPLHEIIAQISNSISPLIENN